MPYIDGSYPPKNRTETELGIIELVITGSNGDHAFNPNTLFIAVIEGRLDFGDPVEPSFLSGDPGYLYREDDLKVALSKNEIVRMTGRELTGEEYFKLREQFGIFHTIHDDFYDQDTGEALQPKGIADGFGGAGARRNH